MSGDTLNWFFSTIAQTYGAVVGILGFLMVFRFQNMRQIRSELRQRLLEIMTAIFGLRAMRWPPNEMIRNYRRPHSESEKTEFENLMDEERENLRYDIIAMERAGNYADRMIDRFKSFFAYHLFIIVGSIGAIYLFPPIADFLKNHNAFEEDGFVTALIMLLIWLFIISLKQIWPFTMLLLEGLEETKEQEPIKGGGD